MEKPTKQQQQIIMLAAVLLVILGVLVYSFRDRFLPHPIAGDSLPEASVRMTFPEINLGVLFDRADFSRLRPYGDVPVRAEIGTGNPNPFVRLSPEEKK